jgi:hypothetical protein
MILETIVFKDSLQMALLLLLGVNLVQIIIISNFTKISNYDLLETVNTTR